MSLVMNHIPPGQVTAKLASLFAPHVPAGLRCDAVLSGVLPGKIMSDDPDQPSWAAVWEAGDGHLYLGGVFGAPVVGYIVATLRRTHEVLVGFRDGDPITKLLPTDPDYTGAALEFFDRPGDGSGLDRFLQQLPEGLELRPIDDMFLKRYPSYGEDSIRRAGSVEAFLNNGRAVCLMRGDLILCEASAGPAIKGVREMGVVTVESYRNRGYATLTCAYLVQLCERSGELTYWNCAKTNLASAAVARKLGYQTEKEFQFVWFGPEE